MTFVWLAEFYDPNVDFESWSFNTLLKYPYMTKKIVVTPETPYRFVKNVCLVTFVKADRPCTLTVRIGRDEFSIPCVCATFIPVYALCEIALHTDVECNVELTVRTLSGHMRNRLVFTEMSVDGGQTWFPMVPEPSAAMLMILALGLSVWGLIQERRSGPVPQTVILDIPNIEI